jgi:hypothetical protein
LPTTALSVLATECVVEILDCELEAGAATGVVSMNLFTDERSQLWRNLTGAVESPDGWGMSIPNQLGRRLLRRVEVFPECIGVGIVVHVLCGYGDGAVL